MVVGELLKASVGTYLTLCAGFCVRYFTIIGGLYWILHVGFKEKWLSRRVQEAFPPPRDVAHEIRWSMINGAFTGLSGLVLYRLIHEGRTTMYFSVSDYGWMYFLASIVLGIAGYDTWIYWQHRLLHTRWLYRHVHAVHHTTNPTAFASLARHPVEAFIEQIYYILFILFVPVHPAAIGAVFMLFFANGVIAHLGYEFYPRAFTRHSLLGWVSTSTYHNMHHSLAGCNYGNAFNCWDRLMGTSHPAYHRTFDAVKARVEAATEVRRAAARPGVGESASTCPAA